MSLRAIKWAFEAGQAARLSTVQRIVLHALAYHHNDKTNSCTPSIETLGAETGLSRRAVQMAVQELVVSGLVTASPRALQGIQTSNQYDLFGRIEGRTSCTPRGASRAPGGAHETAHQGRTTCAQTFLTTEGSAPNVTLFPSQRGGMR